MENEISQVLVDEKSIQEKIVKLGQEISKQFIDEELVLIWIVNGALIFAADLVRHITIPLKIDCIRPSLTDEVHSDDNLTRLNFGIAGQSVLLVDVVVNSGKTIQNAIDRLQKHNPKKIYTCVLLDKRSDFSVRVEPDYIGFHIEDHFVVGYGLDFAERYRHLPYIGVLSPDCQNPPEWI